MAVKKDKFQILFESRVLREKKPVKDSNQDKAGAAEEAMGFFNKLKSVEKNDDTVLKYIERINKSPKEFDKMSMDDHLEAIVDFDPTLEEALSKTQRNILIGMASLLLGGALSPIGDYFDDNPAEKPQIEMAQKSGGSTDGDSDGDNNPDEEEDPFSHLPPEVRAKILKARGSAIDSESDFKAGEGARLATSEAVSDILDRMIDSKLTKLSDKDIDVLSKALKEIPTKSPAFNKSINDFLNSVKYGHWDLRMGGEDPFGNKGPTLDVPVSKFITNVVIKSIENPLSDTYGEYYDELYKSLMDYEKASSGFKTAKNNATVSKGPEAYETHFNNKW